MKSKRVKNKRGGGCSTGFRYDYNNPVADGVPSIVKVENCQSGGAKKRRSVKKLTPVKVNDKKLNLIIRKLCSSMKKKCTPKYRKLLKKIVVNNM
jgi:hypothetical protein